MGLQARMSEADPRLYNPNRDVAHNFADVMREVASRLEDGNWAFLAALLEEKGVSQDDLGRACQAACRWVASATENPKEKMGDCLVRCGFWDVPELANVALMAVVGTVLFGYYWVGVREATLGGQGPTLTCQDLREAGRQAHQAMIIPRWRRRLAKWKAWFAGIGSAIWGTR